MRKHLTYANVVATLALFVAVAGGSTAVAISAKKAPKNSVTSASIRDGSVTANDLAKTTIVPDSQRFINPTAVCPGNDRLLSGGGNAVNEFGVTEFSAKLQRSGPVPAVLDGRDGWQVQGTPGANVFAICLAAKPGK